ncbi:MAG: hypothetical protein Q8L45_09020 [Xanthomonadaceae bacterium]|nr:hypothetical protein [Xanthomonadaceae bacterium]MDP2184104.1 hypothetical protein [Xanthomonadales bacterium]MDZ4115882.1 hypothetical protein [Xanthomonadaceae bacterium]MDZ4377201.1 hypothetical protein [Xanthomonadaceae bacterium]
MFRLFVHDDAVTDLEYLWTNDPAAAARIAVLLQECEGNQDLLDRLTQHKFGADRAADIDVSMWQEQQQKRRNLWRLKIWDLENKGLRYRIVYAFIPQKHFYHVLAVAPREFNYDESHPLTQRILRAYEEF